MSFENTVLPGSLFNEIFGEITMYKFIDDDFKDGVKSLEVGLNKTTTMITTSTGHTYGGYKIYTQEDMLVNLKKCIRATFYTEVTVPDDAQVFIANDYCETDQIVIMEFKPIIELPFWEDPEFCKEAIKVDATNIKYMKNITDQMWIEAISRDINVLKDIEYPTEEMCLAGLNKSWFAFTHIKNPTYAICLAAIKKDVYILKYIPKHMLTEEIYMEVINKTPIAIFSIPTDFLTMSLVKFAVSKNPVFLSRSELKDFLCEELYLVAVTADGNAIQYVPKVDTTYNIMLAAVTSKGKSIDYLDATEQTEELCIAAVTSDYAALPHCIFKSDRVYDAAFASNVNAIKFIPESKWTSDMIQKALIGNPDLVSLLKKVPDAYVNDKLRLDPIYILNIDEPTEDQLLIVAKANPKVLQQVDEKFITEKIKLECIKKDPSSHRLFSNPSEQMLIQAVKCRWQEIHNIKNPSEAVAIEVVKQNGMAIQYILNKTSTVCMEALTQNKQCYIFIGSDMTEEVALHLVKISGYMIRNVPERLRTAQVCLEAVKTDAYAILQIRLNTFDPETRFMIEETALKVNGLTLIYINNKTFKHCKIALESNIKAIRHINQDLPKEQIEELCWYCIKKDATIFEDVKYKTVEMYLYVVSKFAHMIRHFDDNKVDEQLYLHASLINPDCVGLIKNEAIKNRCKKVINVLAYKN